MYFICCFILCLLLICAILITHKQYERIIIQYNSRDKTDYHRYVQKNTHLNIVSRSRNEICLYTLDDLFDEKIVFILEKDLKYKSCKELCDKTSHKR